MRLAMIGIAALVVGTLGGALFSGNRMKGAIMEERAQAAADSLEALGRFEVTNTSHDEPDGGDATTAPLPDRATAEGRLDTASSGVGGASPSGSRPPVTAAVLDPSRTPSGPERASTGAAVVAPDVGGTGVSAEAPETDQASPSGGPEVASVAASAGAAADSAAIQGAMQLARMFSSMKPVDAAAVLQELTDAEVDAILRHMQARLAGQILGEFEPARAALLSRTVLGGEPTP